MLVGDYSFFSVSEGVSVEQAKIVVMERFFCSIREFAKEHPEIFFVKQVSTDDPCAGGFYVGLKFDLMTMSGDCSREKCDDMKSMSAEVRHGEWVPVEEGVK